MDEAERAGHAGRGWAAQALADVTPAPSEDDVESSHEETKSKKAKTGRRGKRQGRHV